MDWFLYTVFPQLSPGLLSALSHSAVNGVQFLAKLSFDTRIGISLKKHFYVIVCRAIVARRCFFMIATLYLYRCITMYITTLPVPGKHLECAPKVCKGAPKYTHLFTSRPSSVKDCLSCPCSSTTMWRRKCGGLSGWSQEEVKLDL